MTIVVGVLCKDGVVIGADSSATFAAGQLRTVEQETKKIDIIADKIIVAGTGQIGLGQRFCFQVEQAWSNGKFKSKAPIEMATQMCQLGIQDFASTHVDKGQYGALVAFPAAHKINLCEFSTTDFQPELKTERLWYASMGSGQPIVDPFLGLMRDVFWAAGPPTCQEATLIITWALVHTIKVNPGGVNGPIQLASLNRQNNEFKARLLDDAELLEHKNNVDGAIAHLRKYADVLGGRSDQNAPDLPKP